MGDIMLRLTGLGIPYAVAKSAAIASWETLREQWFLTALQEVQRHLLSEQDNGDIDKENKPPGAEAD
jgi:hypothetical protein